MSFNDSQLISLSFLVTLSFAFLLPHQACGTHSNNRSGTQMNQQRNARDAATAQRVSEGVWGGDHVRMEVSRKGTTVEFDCAHGQIIEPLTLDSTGRFVAKGTYTREHGGPMRDSENAAQPVTYSGNIKDQTMKLSITLTNSSENVGTFTLKHGSEGNLVKCL